jgi:hypothetical protein
VWRHMATRVREADNLDKAGRRASLFLGRGPYTANRSRSKVELGAISLAWCVLAAHGESCAVTRTSCDTHLHTGHTLPVLPRVR